jgi:hypothetical protein
MDNSMNKQKWGIGFDFVIVSIVSQSLRAGYKNSLRVGEAAGEILW